MFLQEPIRTWTVHFRKCHSLSATSQGFQAPWKLDLPSPILPHPLFFLCANMCMVCIMCIYVFACVQVCMRVHTLVCRGLNHSVLYQGRATPWTQSPPLLTSLARWLTPGGPCPVTLLSSAGITSVRHLFGLWFWGSRLWSWCLHSKCFIPWVLLAQTWFFILLGSLHFCCCFVVQGSKSGPHIHWQVLRPQRCTSSHLELPASSCPFPFPFYLY